MSHKQNFTGYLANAKYEATVSCSTLNPCYDIFFDDIDLTINASTSAVATSSCKYIAPGGVHGLNGSSCTD
jgi:galacturan 1,4-alpha-galacturonidase